MTEEIRRFPSKLNSWNKPAVIAVSVLLIGWLFITPAGLLGKADAIAYAVCHRIDSRSFHLGTRQIPLCARCTGMYLGALTGLGYQYAIGRRRTGSPPRLVIAVLAVLVALFIIDGGNSYLSMFPGFPHLYQSTNWLRLFSGTGMGLVISMALFPAYNFTIWCDIDQRPAIDDLHSLFIALFFAAIVDLLVISGNPLLLYPLALVSAGGVLVLLTMVYCMITVIVLKIENKFSTLRQLFLPITMGFGLALLQIILLDGIRFLFTGTWEGFHIG